MCPSEGPFILPDDVKAGDYIEVGMLGAYGCAMRTEFNGFGETETIVVEDEPMASLYARVPANDSGNVVRFEKRSAQ